MAYDFWKSSERHFTTAEYLDQGASLGDAAHMYGLAAECAVKSVLLGTGELTLLPNGEFSEGKFKKHIERLLPILPQVMSGRLWPSYYAIIQADIGSFSSWNIDDRYRNETSIALGDYPRWKQAAARANSMLALAASHGCAS
jgi:hypothetical protein